jgi:histone acetyltransferase
MPQDYITRFIFHPRHATCLVFKDGKGIGAICYRPFFQFHFTEIVFAAVLPEFRGSGYGRLLMNYVKDHLQAQDIRYLIVYADDSAIGYFHRVGFSTQFPSDAPQDYFKPYVSQYDSATLMISPIDPDLDYKNSNFWTAAVREYLSSQYKVGEEKQIRRWPVTSIAGIPVPRVPPEPPIEDIMTVILDRIWSHPSATPFRQPVSCADSPFYRNFTENPMDLSTIRSKVKQQKYKKFNNFMNDLRLIFTNCYQYNGDSSPYTKTAQDLERFVRDITEPILKSKGIKERWEWMTE